MDSIVPCSIELFLGLQPEMAELDDEEEDDEGDEDDDDEDDGKKKNVCIHTINRERSLVAVKVVIPRKPRSPNASNSEC